MTAEQASQMSKKRVYVLPSKSIGSGYALLSLLDFDKDNEAVQEQMTKILSRISVGCVSLSVRDADISGIHINRGEYIGIVDKQVRVARRDRLKATLRLCRMLLKGEKSTLTVFVGEGVGEDEQKRLRACLLRAYSSVEIYFFDGGQPIYPYILVSE